MNISNTSNVSFGNIYLYNFKHKESAADMVMNAALEGATTENDLEKIEPTYPKGSKELVVSVGPKQVLVLDGRDFIDFKKCDDFEFQNGLRYWCDNKSRFESYAKRAIKFNMNA